MKTKINFIISAISLMVTATLLVLCMYSWYVTNEIATVSNIVATTKGQEGSFDLYYWSTSSQRWVIADNTMTVEAWPGDSIYFKLVATDLEVGSTCKGNFEGISTTLNNEVVKATKVGDSYVVSYNDTPMYSSSSSSIKVNTNDVLYDLSLNDETEKYEIELDHYKIENVFKLYTAPVIDSNDKPTNIGETYTESLTSTIFDVSVNETTMTKYFALSFVSTGNDETDSYYQYQGLKFASLVIGL